MDSLVLTFTIYAVPANLIGGMFYVVGREKAGLLVSEYFFIYAPLLALLILSFSFFDASIMVSEQYSLRLFITALQAAGAGVLGGLVLWARFLFPAETTAKKLRITAISALVMFTVYAITRIALFAAIRAVL